MKDCSWAEGGPTLTLSLLIMPTLPSSPQSESVPGGPWAPARALLLSLCTQGLLRAGPPAAVSSQTLQFTGNLSSSITPDSLQLQRLNIDHSKFNIPSSL